MTKEVAVNERLIERSPIDRDPFWRPELRPEGRSLRARFTHVEAHRRFVCWGPRNAGMKRFVTTAAQRGWSRFHPPAEDLPAQWDAYGQLEYASLTLTGTRISLCAVPDHVRGSALARSVLREADRILLFVPTSADRIEDTVRSQELLEVTLRELGRRPEDAPLVWIWTESADPGERLTVEELENMFNPLGQPSFSLEPGASYAESARLACAALAGGLPPTR